VSEDIEKENPKKEVGSIIDNMNNEVSIELLDKIRNSDPYFFEQLVVDLLSRMGYSGEGGSAKVTSRSNDGGIDGIINQDPLGTSTVYLQAKRYKEDNKINRSDIQTFYGALASVRADRGVFITTSSYTSGAKEFAINQGIVLIDGIQLTELMLKYKVGVEAENQYTIFRIDNDYFELNNI
ncbi:restriction endonuclease, partial [Listeria monocytogenes]|nr:restriction endonuclease [Listeria monocytogenes]